MLIDTHAHLYWDSYKPDLEEVLKRAKEAGIAAIINIGVDLETSKKALEQVQNLNIPGMFFYSTIGIHPEEADTFVPEDIDKLEQIYKSCPEKVVGIGECGLDFLYDSKDLQKKLFQSQIDLANKLNLPLVVHCREAWNETLKMIGKQLTVLHCYSGLPQNTKYIIQNTNLYVSFAVNITYPKNEYLREAAKLIPLTRILLETDSPFLAPQSKRGQRNEPSSVKEIAELIADLKGISFEEIANQTTQNAKEIFQFAF